VRQIFRAGYVGSGPILLPHSEGSTGQAFAVAFLLVPSDLTQYGAQSIVRDDRAPRDVGVLVEEDSAGEGPVFAHYQADIKPTEMGIRWIHDLLERLGLHSSAKTGLPRRLVRRDPGEGGSLKGEVGCLAQRSIIPL
jgi:hypothetical protein